MGMGFGASEFAFKEKGAGFRLHGARHGVRSSEFSSDTMD